MIDNSTEQKQEERGKPQFLLTGFTQAAAIRIYSFDGRIESRRTPYTVEVNLALIPGYGIQIQELPLLCRELLQQRAQLDGICAVVFTEQRMRSHAERLALAKDQAEEKKQQRKHLASAGVETDWRPPLR
jgi:hypothetical protein